jgi:hypothetical protein
VSWLCVKSLWVRRVLTHVVLHATTVGGATTPADTRFRGLCRTPVSRMYGTINSSLIVPLVEWCWWWN